MEKTERAQLKALLSALIETSPSNETPQDQESSKRVESFVPFTWTPHIKHPPTEINLISHTHDIASGLELALQLIEQSWLDRDYEDIVPDIHQGQASRLMRFAIASCSLLAERAEQVLSRAEDAAQKKQKIGK